VQYNDSWTDIAFIALCRIAYGNIAGWQSSRRWVAGPRHAPSVASRCSPTQRAPDQPSAVCRAALCSWTDGPETFKGMVEVSRRLMKGRTAQQQRDAVIQGFPQVPAWFHRCGRGHRGRKCPV
jgi:hypothetical protein